MQTQFIWLREALADAVLHLVISSSALGPFNNSWTFDDSYHDITSVLSKQDHDFQWDPWATLNIWTF